MSSGDFHEIGENNWVLRNQGAGMHNIYDTNVIFNLFYFIVGDPVIRKTAIKMFPLRTLI